VTARVSLNFCRTCRDGRCRRGLDVHNVPRGVREAAGSGSTAGRLGCLQTLQPGEGGRCSGKLSGGLTARPIERVWNQPKTELRDFSKGSGTPWAFQLRMGNCNALIFQGEAWSGRSDSNPRPPAPKESE